MKVVVFGGAGDMGSQTVEDLARSEGIERVTIADRNRAAAEALAARLGAARARVDAVAVDARDHGALVAAMRGYDVAASALGPFFEFELRLGRAAVEARVDYASICDDWSAAREVLDELDAPARAAGCTILTGLGASPGITNVGVRYFASQLDRLRRVEISVYQPLDAGGGEAVLRHMLHVMTGQVASWRGGRAVMLPACSERRTVEFPRFGPVRVWNMGHAEPVTVPRFFPGVEEVSFYMGFGRGAELFVHPARLGLFARPRAVDLTVRAALALERVIKRPPAPGAVRMDVWGDRDGREVHLMGCGTGEMRATTGLSLSVGAQLLGRKQTAARGGVLAPEACLDPLAFLDGMRARGVVAYEDLAMQKPLGAARPAGRPEDRTGASPG